jgi:hypothetical protein
MSRALTVPAVMLAVLAGPACFPMLTHGARVDPGARLGMTSSMQVVARPAPVDSSSPAKTEPGMDFGFYLAGTARPKGWREGGVRGTAALSLFSGFTADLYGQLPRHLPGSSATGVGVLYQPSFRNLVFPYVMNGWELPDGSQLYITLGVANTRGMADGRSERHFMFAAAVGWQPASVGRTLRPLSGFTTYLMFTAGRQGPDCERAGWCIGGTSRVIMAVSADLPSFKKRCAGPPSGDPNTGRCAPPGGPRRPPVLPPRGRPPMRSVQPALLSP